MHALGPPEASVLLADVLCNLASHEIAGARLELSCRLLDDLQPRRDPDRDRWRGGPTDCPLPSRRDSTMAMVNSYRLHQSRVLSVVRLSFFPSSLDDLLSPFVAWRQTDSKA